MTMPPRLRNVVLTAHLVVSVGWLAAAVAYAGLVVAALKSQDAQMVRATYLAIQPMLWFAIVPLAFAALLTGIAQSLGTPWGLFRHYWVIFKLVLTVIATGILLKNTATVDGWSALARETASTDVNGLKGQLIHAVGGVVVLLLITVLGVCKPKGMTRYGWRKHHEQGRSTRSELA